jgi:hypothetical protein
VKKGGLLSWQSSLLQKPPLTSTIRLQDNGSINYPATIDLKVKDILGHTKYSLTTQKELLPQTIRRITIPWNKTPSIGLFKVTGEVQFLNQTKNLPTKWVLVLSSTFRLIILAFVLVLILLTIVKSLYSKKRKLKNNLGNVRK